MMVVKLIKSNQIISIFLFKRMNAIIDTNNSMSPIHHRAIISTNVLSIGHVNWNMI